MGGWGGSDAGAGPQRGGWRTDGAPGRARRAALASRRAREYLRLKIGLRELAAPSGGGVARSQTRARSPATSMIGLSKWHAMSSRCSCFFDGIEPVSKRCRLGG